MSTDLEFRRQLPQLRLPIIRTTTPAPTIPPPISCTDGGDDECHTPTSTGNRIPAIVTCPPAPKKPSGRAAISCKRKLFELDFFEIVAREEVESFFGSVNLGDVLKRRCRCT